jgi:ketosteroid isomerase-like protein
VSQSTSPRAVFEQLLHGIEHREWDALSELYAPDAVVEQPFAIPEPSRLVGQDAVRAHFARAARAPFAMRPRNVVVHDTTDPEVIVAEFDYDVTVTSTGRTFTTSNVQVIRVRDGRIVASRDYHDHCALARAVGALPGSAPTPSAGGSAAR